LYTINNKSLNGGVEKMEEEITIFKTERETVLEKKLTII